MKNRNIFILITALCLTAFILSACGYLDGSEQGSININFDNSGARYAIDKTDLIYTITLTSPGKDTITKTTKEGETSISIPVSEGAWKIDVQAEGSRVRGVGDANVAVTAGKPAPANIKMRVTGTRVSSWSELVADFDGINANDLKYLESIVIVENLTAYSSPEQDPPKAINLQNGQTITLWSEKNVTITRDIISTSSNSAINVTVFKITKGTLILDGEKGGTIEIDGKSNRIDNCERALINVTPDGNNNATLIMRKGVTLTNNKTKLGGGVYVKGTSAYFYMNGGTISDNTASVSGGGVHIESGTFRKTGGTIYAGQDEKRNSSPKGNAVYFSVSNKAIDITLEPDKDENGDDILH